MAGPDPGPFSQFADFVGVTKETHIGHDLAGKPKPYVPFSALREYWTRAKISSVLGAFSRPLELDVAVIRRSYLRIFSTLVYTEPGAVRNLADLFIRHSFTDERLPWTSRPSEWRDTPFFNKFFKQISGNQWQFFPLRFHPDHLQNRLLDQHCVLPIDFEAEHIAQGPVANIRAFTIHAEYNDLPVEDNARDRNAQHTFVFKIYHNRRRELSYKNERRALMQLSSDPSPNVVSFYGSLQQRGLSSLILQYADGGDLGQFFANTPPPATVEDVVDFWKSLFKVFAGLERIHQLMQFHGEQYIMGIHQDIRPENILLMRGASASPYRFTPKIADFGLHSHVRIVKGSDKGLDLYGNQRFSAPECCHHTISRHSGRNMITTSADIFSIGAVLSHTVAWVVGGRQEQEDYFTARKAHHENEPRLRRFKNSGYEGCFHDSIDPLPVVAEQHKRYIQRLRPSDDVTPNIIDWIEQCMLVRGTQNRLPAKDIQEKFHQLLDSRSAPSPGPTPSAVSELTPEPSCWSVPVNPSLSTIDGVSPPPPDAAPPGTGLEPTVRPALQVVVSFHGDDTNTAAIAPSPQLRPSDAMSASAPSLDEGSLCSPSRAQIGISEIQRFKSDAHQGKPVDPQTSELVSYLEHNLGGRDQFFFIDDSASMGAEKKTIAEGFGALACLAKRLDPNRLELAFASRPHKIHRARHTSRLLELVRRCPYRGEGHLMENRLGWLVDEKIIPRLPWKLLGRNVNPWARRQVSLYVFTDGDWGPEASSGDACGVERPVRRLIEELKKRRLDRTQVSLHFVMFGNKANGRKHLERLDEFGTKDGWDIVDVKHIGGEVAGMIIGPLTRSNDDIPAVAG